MEQPLAKIDPTLLALMHGSFGKNGALQPFARETMLMECQIAGIAHHNAKKVETHLAAGTMLTLQRDPGNAYDRFAIMILTEAGDHLGYVPRAKNETLARLMDAGKLLFAKLESKAWQGDWLRISAHIYLRDF